MQVMAGNMRAQIEKDEDDAIESTDISLDFEKFVKMASRFNKLPDNNIQMIFESTLLTGISRGAGGGGETGRSYNTSSARGSSEPAGTNISLSR